MTKTPFGQSIKNSAFTRDESGVLFRKPDLSMKKKLGMGKSIKALLNDEAIERAEDAVSENTPEMLREIQNGLTELGKILTRLEVDTIATPDIKLIMERAFDIKSKAGFCNYPMASAFARFMYLYCEPVMAAPLTFKHVSMLQSCHQLLLHIFENAFAGEGNNESLDDFWENEPSPFDGL